MIAERQTHWENVYSTKDEQAVSWFQETPSPSTELLALAGASPSSSIIDVGGGASRLVDVLLEEGFADLTVLDLSATALAAAKARLGTRAKNVNWIVADATEWAPPRLYDVWHDRAAFHFLTAESEQQSYVARLRRGVREGGHTIIGTFALDGPEKCSGLPIMRHSAESLAALLGEGFELTDTRRHEHTAPSGARQAFQFSTFKRVAW